MIVGDVHFYANIWPKVTHPLQNAHFQSISARSAWAVTPSEKVQLTRIGTPLRAYSEPKMNSVRCP